VKKIYQLLVINFLFSQVLFSQNLLLTSSEEKIIIISDKLGEVIDADERDYYKILPAIKNFKSAVFLKLPDNQNVLEVTYERGGELKKIRIAQTEEDIAEIRNYINNYKYEPSISLHENEPAINAARPTQQDYCWLNIGSGFIFSAQIVGIAFGSNISYKKGSILMSVRSVSALGFSGTGMWDVGILFGIVHEDDPRTVSVAAGIGYVSASTNDGRLVHTVGIPLEVQFSKHLFSHLSFCGYGFMNLNMTQISVGVLACIQFWKI